MVFRSWWERRNMDRSDLQETCLHLSILRKTKKPCFDFIFDILFCILTNSWDSQQENFPWLFYFMIRNWFDWFLSLQCGFLLFPFLVENLYLLSNFDLKNILICLTMTCLLLVFMFNGASSVFIQDCAWKGRIVFDGTSKPCFIVVMVWHQQKNLFSSSSDCINW